jgi:hypothetical protein
MKIQSSEEMDSTYRELNPEGIQPLGFNEKRKRGMQTEIEAEWKR